MGRSAPRTTWCGATPRALLFAALLVGSGGACQLLSSLEPAALPAQDAGEASVADAQPDAVVRECSDDPVVSACARLPPCRPAILDDGESKVAFAFGYVDFQGDAKRPDICPAGGFDLDGKTTCYRGTAYSPKGVCAPEEECADSCKPVRSFSPDDRCDFADGIDNSIGRGFAQIRQLSPSTISRMDPNLHSREGNANVLLELRGYNEQADDTLVEVYFFESSGLATRANVLSPAGAAWFDAGDAQTIDGSSNVLDAWDGTSRRIWDVVRDSALIRPDGVGYVRNHVLVVSSLNVEIRLGAVGFAVSDGMLRGELRRRDDGWELVRGRFGGRVSRDEMLRQSGGLFCNGGKVDWSSAEVQAAMLQICAMPDVSSSASQTDPCDSLSFGITFTGAPAVVGIQRERGEIVGVCDAGPPPSGCAQ